MKGRRALFVALLVALYAIGTTSPFTPGVLPRAWSLRIEPLDLLGNVVAFLPLGFALGRIPLVRAFAVGFGLSLVLEWLQRHLLRTPSPIDVLLNALGTAMGAAAARRTWPRLSRTVLATVALGLGLLGHGLADRAGRTPTPIDLSVWQPMPIVFRDEPDADRRFEGELQSLWIFDRALDDQEVLSGLGAPPDHWPAPVSAACALRWPEAGQALVRGPDGAFRLESLVTAADRQGVEKTLLPADRGPWFHRAAGADRTWRPPESLTVVALVQPSASDFRHETRIVTYGRSIWRKNFSLGTLDGTLNWRVASSVTDLAGNGPGLRAWRGQRTADGTPVWVVGRFDAVRTRLDQFHPESRELEPIGEAAIHPLRTPSPLRQGGPAFLALASACMAFGMAGLTGRPRLSAAVALLSLGLHTQFSPPLTTGAFAAHPLGDLVLLPAAGVSLLAAALGAKPSRVSTDPTPPPEAHA